MGFQAHLLGTQCNHEVYITQVHSVSGTDERTVKFFSPSPILMRKKLNPIQSSSANFLKFISPVRVLSIHVKSCIFSDSVYFAS